MKWALLTALVLVAIVGGFLLAVLVPRFASDSGGPTPVLVTTQTIEPPPIRVGGTRWGLVLLNPPHKGPTSAKVGDTLTVVGWSPPSMKGQRYQLCTATRGQIGVVLCIDNRKLLTGTVQTFGTWRVRASEPPERVLKISLVVLGKRRASDAVPIR